MTKHDDGLTPSLFADSRNLEKQRYYRINNKIVCTKLKIGLHQLVTINYPIFLNNMILELNGISREILGRFVANSQLMLLHGNHTMLTQTFQGAIAINIWSTILKVRTCQGKVFHEGPDLHQESQKSSLSNLKIKGSF